VAGTGGAGGGAGDGPEAAVSYVDDRDGEGGARGELEEPSLVRDGAVGLEEERERMLAAVGNAHLYSCPVSTEGGTRRVHLVRGEGGGRLHRRHGVLSAHHAPRLRAPAARAQRGGADVRSPSFVVLPILRSWFPIQVESLVARAPQQHPAECLVA